MQELHSPGSSSRVLPIAAATAADLGSDAAVSSNFLAFACQTCAFSLYCAALCVPSHRQFALKFSGLLSFTIARQLMKFENIVGYEAHILLKGSCARIVPVLDTNAPQIFAGTYPILDEMKLLMDLYKEMTAETISTDKFKNVPEGPLSGEIQYGQKHNHQYAKPTEQPSAPVLLGTISDKQTQGTYIVGGSAFGWNFVTYPDQVVLSCCLIGCYVLISFNFTCEEITACLDRNLGKETENGT
ncbi:hypothetical protein TEA_024368 [Camellia sinensis var. sinensis]|uniref:Uncharacterized protein n=1 Tax=Camellia sinensis var. sinensis TaxID=542762 RepID=A0A4S4D6Y4_CAMSN|nr:hypothetical protein TEA_024368 [Camellia sinensis var. sinensis]